MRKFADLWLIVKRAGLTPAQVADFKANYGTRLPLGDAPRAVH